LSEITLLFLDYLFFKAFSNLV